MFNRSATDWSPFQRNLIKATAEDGFRLDFVLLAGPDQINPKCDIPWGTWGGCMEFVVSDISRPGFVSPSGDLRKMQDCGTWRVCPVDRELEQEKARKQVAQTMGLLITIPKLLDETLKKGKSVRKFRGP